MYIVLEHNAFDKTVIARGILARKKVALDHCVAINNTIQNNSEWAKVHTMTEFKHKYKKHATA